MNKIDFNLKLTKRGKEGYFLYNKHYRDDVSTLNMYAPNTKVLIFEKTKQNKKHYYSLNHILTLPYFNALFLPIDRSSRQSVNRETIELTDIIN